MFRSYSLLVVFLLAVCSMLHAKEANYQLPNGEVLQDPTRPAGWSTRKAAPKASRTYKLNYILHADGRKQAMINGQKVSEGDYVSGARVIRIREEAVTIEYDGRMQDLRVHKVSGFKKSS